MQLDLLHEKYGNIHVHYGIMALDSRKELGDMKEKYYEDLGLDDGINILEKFKINIDEIIENKEDKEVKDNDKK